MLAGVETMLRHRDILQGVQFKWITDHKGLVHLLSQRNLSGRQARWIEKISEFSFEVEYVAGSENVVADALSRMYSADSLGTIRAKSEYTYFDVVNEDGLDLEETSAPVLAGIEARVAVQRRPRKAVPGAETGRPETSKEFAVRMRDRFVLKPPAERKEGESTGSRARTMPAANSTTPAVSAGKLEIKIPHALRIVQLYLDLTQILDPQLRLIPRLMWKSRRMFLGKNTHRCSL